METLDVRQPQDLTIEAGRYLLTKVMRTFGPDSLVDAQWRCNITQEMAVEKLHLQTQTVILNHVTTKEGFMDRDPQPVTKTFLGRLLVVDFQTPENELILETIQGTVLGKIVGLSVPKIMQIVAANAPSEIGTTR